jgi:crotonobetainyl-CoA:carnitine CoA-transferase CaiB-like acyl-CoA transferase
VLGLPFLFVWYVGGVFAVFAGLVALYLIEEEGRGQ